MEVLFTSSEAWSLRILNPCIIQTLWTKWVLPHMVFHNASIDNLRHQPPKQMWWWCHCWYSSTKSHTLGRQEKSKLQDAGERKHCSSDKESKEGIQMPATDQEETEKTMQTTLASCKDKQKCVCIFWRGSVALIYGRNAKKWNFKFYHVTRRKKESYFIIVIVQCTKFKLRIFSSLSAIRYDSKHNPQKLP